MTGERQRVRRPPLADGAPPVAGEPLPARTTTSTPNSLLARDVMMPFAAPAIAPLGGPNPFAGTRSPAWPKEVESAVKSYVADHRAGWNDANARGALSLVEVVQEIRGKVPGAAPFEVEIRLELAPLALPDQRKAGRVTVPELIAMLQAHLTIPAAELKVGRTGGKLSLAATGIAFESHVRSLTVAAELTPSAVTFSSEGAVRAEVKLERGDRGFDHWSVGLGFALAGGDADEPDVDMASLGATIDAARQGAVAAATAIAGGAKPTDAAVTAHFKPVKEAAEALGKLGAPAKPDAPRVTLSFGADGGKGAPPSLAATLTVRF